MSKGYFFAAFLLVSPLSAQDLLTYWNFNNGTKGADTTLTMWKPEPALFGEAYDPEAKRLSSNTNFNTVFHGKNIYVDFSSLAGGGGGSVAQSWGLFTDTKSNKLKEDESEGGSFLTGPSNDSNHITFALSSEGYKNLVVTYAHRANQGSGAIQWSYSLDGENFQPVSEISKQTNFSRETLNLSGEGGLGLEALNNRKALYLRATFLFPAKPAGSIAIDNFQFLGSPIK